MTFEEFQEHCMRTANTGLSEREQLTNSALGIAGEAGEVADYLKKHLFHGHPLDENKLKEELGDLYWYCAWLMKITNLKFEDVLDYNIQKLEARYKDGFSSEASINRKE